MIKISLLRQRHIELYAIDSINLLYFSLSDEDEKNFSFRSPE